MIAPSGVKALLLRSTGRGSFRPRDVAISQPSDPERMVNSMTDIANGDSRAFRRTWLEYRAYAVGSDGHFIQCDEMICRDDGEAIAQAKGLMGDSDIEVWNHNRFVIRLVHRPR